MAKKSTMLFRLLSSAGTGYFYVGKKNVRYVFHDSQRHSKKIEFN
jgi:ribosomal protein L33